MITTEDVHKAVAEKLKAVPGIKTFSRRWEQWNNKAPPQMPALYMVSRSSTPRTTQGLPQVWTITIDLVVYVNNGGGNNLIVSKLLNEVKDNIRYALRPNAVTGIQDLGFEDNVAYCRLGAFEDQEVLEGNVSSCVGSIEILFAGCY